MTLDEETCDALLDEITELGESWPGDAPLWAATNLILQRLSFQRDTDLKQEVERAKARRDRLKSDAKPK